MIIVETGAGLANANSYVSVTDADTYFADRAVTKWAALSSGDKSAALIRATDYLDTMFVFRSVPLLDTQSLQNPRYGETVLNPAVVKACLEVALISLTNDLFEVLPQSRVTDEEVWVGKVRSKTTYDLNNRTADRFPQIAALLKKVASRRGSSASSTAMSAPRDVYPWGYMYGFPVPR
ncbi:hypothetical protein QH494_02525 [Sphingomonas sp. AR_OL41]|uniref:DnaT-like ssDNA-binding protein n=1 Tax=Sphingomonas sp. AR_OL41 TaxID=3042729 RepID=UPI0024806010|nr:DnaT-like ssDNA-binding protein [Sphingomonas sp. AR_OL41]MDH7971044.1 hypothetical protein [Sphingomonas sp. AR_OL41]